MKKWFTSPNVSQKLALICLFFLLPNSVMLYLLITGINEQIQFSRKEQKGIEYQRPLEDLLEFVPQHGQLAARVLGGETSAREPRAKLEARVDKSFADLASVDSRIGEDLQFTDEGLAKRRREHFRFTTLRAEWEELKSRLAALQPEDCASRHLHLVADVRTMITHAGDLSNLILDPELDSYYLMDATLLALPQTQDRLAAAIADGNAILESPTSTQANRQRQATHATLLRDADFNRIRASLQTALDEDPNFHGISATLQPRLRPALDEFAAAMEVFIKLTALLASPDQPKVTGEEHLAAGAKARDASFKLWKVAAQELDALLELRIEAYQRSRARSLLVAGMALMAAIGFVSFITRSLSGPLQRQATELTAANAALQVEVAERQQVEQRLRDSLRSLEGINAVIDRACIIATTDLRGTITHANDNFCKISEYSREEVLGQNHRLLKSGHHSDSFFIELWRAIANGEVWRGEVKNRAKSGRTYWVDTTIGPMLDGQGKPKGYLAIRTDITERKEAEVRLERTQKQLLETSRHAGMAEVATGVLHNVGNVLNSVNVSATLLGDRLRKSKTAGFVKIAALLKEKAGDLPGFFARDARAGQLPGYLEQFAQHLTTEQQAMLGEVENLRKNIEHIKDIVAMQQSYAKVSGVTEAVNPAELIEDTLRMNAGALDRHSIEVVKEIEDVPLIEVDKHKVLQILVNFVRNAKYACDDSGRTDKRITLRVRQREDRVTFLVIDNGVGIPAENLARIFNHGFTTRKDGHGFGLHSGANAAKELGGEMTVHSDGLGQGATFTLELPLAPNTGNNSDRSATPNSRLSSLRAA